MSKPVLLIASLFAGVLLNSCLGDVYMHNPRGSNNRNCRNDNNDRRRNGNRLFDSQNNDKGGYSCPRAYPFTSNNAQGTVDEFGVLTGPNAINTDTFFYYEGTTLNLEWTNQHGCGDNGNLDCRIILQYTCNTDPLAGDEFLQSITANKYIRDGTPVNNNDNNNVNDEATTTIPQDEDDSDCDSNGNVNPANCTLDGRYGFQEPFAWYDYCKARERNKGLFTADQLPLNSNIRNRAINTRQNPGGTRRGLECPEERDYYPYWIPSMWKDIAVGVPAASLDSCKQYVKDSQNVKDKNYCYFSGNKPNLIPHTELGCANAGGTWKSGGNWGLPEPECFVLPWMRDNSLGNTETGRPLQYNWTLPNVIGSGDSMRCVLRMRYNASTGDFDQNLNASSNCNPNDMQCTRSPIVDRDNRESMTYVHYFDESDERYKLSMAVNTNQYARTFQDRSYAFDIKKKPSSVQNLCGSRPIHNLNVRGKRGNIVQVYPSVEYDFAPQDMLVKEGDCMHIQWIGSDYNPNRNPNNAEGGPPNPNNNNEAKADRSNMLEVPEASRNYATHVKDMTGSSFFLNSDGSVDRDMVKKFAFIDQDISQCRTFEQINNDNNNNNRQQRERDPTNCGKLNAAKTPYFKGDVIKVRSPGSHKFMSSRNNNFSNRSQKLKIDVEQDNGGNDLSTAQVVGITAGALVAVGALGFLVHKTGAVKKFGFKPEFRANTKPMVVDTKPNV